MLPFGTLFDAIFGKVYKKSVDPRSKCILEPLEGEEGLPSPLPPFRWTPVQPYRQKLRKIHLKYKKLRVTRVLVAARASPRVILENILVFYEVFRLPHHKTLVNYEGLWPSWSYFLVFYDVFCPARPQNLVNDEGLWPSWSYFLVFYDVICLPYPKNLVNYDGLSPS